MRLRLAAGLIFGLLAFTGPAHARSCGELARLALPTARVTSASLVAAGGFVAPAPLPGAMGPPPADFSRVPAFCRVMLTLAPSADSDIRAEVWLPASGWNGKYVGIGNGVWAGTIAYAQMAEPLARGYAVAASDTGHVGNGLDAEWSVGHPEKLVDFGYRAVHETAVKAKAVIAAFYGRPASRAIWTSCSTGGRQGLMEAFRYPADYDAISAMAPANPMTDLMVQTVWTGLQASKGGGGKLAAGKLAAVHAAWLRACDKSDGVADGLVANPRACAFDPVLAGCKGAEGGDCLTPAEVAALRLVYSGVEQGGQHILPGYTPGSEAQLAVLMGGPEPFPVATSYMKLVTFHDRGWDFRTFDYVADRGRARAAGVALVDVPAEGLKAFFARGGKLLLSHGWSDGLIPAENTVAFERRVAKALPGAAQRLFMVPDMGHCGGGDGPFVFDVLGIVDRWAETGVAPERIVATSPPGAPKRSRPLCAWPQVAVWRGAGRGDEAEGFECRGAG